MLHIWWDRESPFQRSKISGTYRACHHSSALGGVAICLKRKDREEKKDVDTHGDVYEVGTQRK